MSNHQAWACGRPTCQAMLLHSSSMSPSSRFLSGLVLPRDCHLLCCVCALSSCASSKPPHDARRPNYGARWWEEVLRSRDAHHERTSRTLHV